MTNKYEFRVEYYSWSTGNFRGAVMLPFIPPLNSYVVVPKYPDTTCKVKKVIISLFGAVRVEVE